MSVPVTAAMPSRRPRLFYLDLVRALATALIVLTHVNNPYLSEGRYLLTNQPFGIYVGDLGVSLFLIISGAALAYTYRRPLNLRRFYWKRFKGIYPMFWLAWGLGTVFFFLDNGGVPLNAAPVRSLIWTVLGVDGLAATLHIRTAYLLGEWFLGFIILFYLVFPLLLWLIERFPVPTAIGLAVVAGLTLLMMRQLPSVPGSVVLTMRLPELAFGIYFVRYVRRIHVTVAVACAGVLMVCGLRPGLLPKDVATAVVGTAAFLILVFLARYVAIPPVRAVVGLVARYSYPIFLVHHVVIIKVFSMMDTSGFLPVQLVMLLGSVCVITFALAVGLDRLTSSVLAFIATAFKDRPWWRLGPVGGES
ncbi:acyltransferase family protein [Actinomyces faecalis]|uniref:acyltransferase family protein n=1 Tax=Actinomyces faecalis TaxID=2722820 RepID=UPI0015542B2A|nr:acyltransferase [Actinomyces faecalis]